VALYKAFSSPPDDLRNGLVSAQVMMTPEAVLAGYRYGVFPWGTNASGAVNWHHPPQRGVLHLAKVKIRRKDRSALVSARWDPDLSVTMNSDFRAVIESCAAMRRERMVVIWAHRVIASACLFSKKLERGRFIWPTPAEGAVTISPAQMGSLLEGIDWRAPQKTWRPGLIMTTYNSQTCWSIGRSLPIWQERMR
jgi:hypothetical protein